jgi:hypothetical protein
MSLYFACFPVDDLPFRCPSPITGTVIPVLPGLENANFVLPVEQSLCLPNIWWIGWLTASNAGALVGLVEKVVANPIILRIVYFAI